MCRYVWVIILIAVTLSSSLCQTVTSRRHVRPLVVGWHDEMNDPALWHPIGLENQPDIYAAQPGLLTLRLPHVPDGYTYQLSVERGYPGDQRGLGHYPVLVAHVSSLDAGSYAHLDIEERGINGRPSPTWRSPTLTKPGLTIVDLGKEIEPTVRRLNLHLIVGGKLSGAKCEYNWIRFVRREDVAYLQEAPNLQNVTSREPTGAPPSPAGQ